MKKKKKQLRRLAFFYFAAFSALTTTCSAEVFYSLYLGVCVRERESAHGKVFEH